MCTRYVLFQKHYRALLARLGIAAPSDFVSRYNIAPGSAVPAVRTARDARGGAAPEAVALHWGFARAWNPAPRTAPLVNARAETLAERPAFRAALRTRRCVLPASGFFEWKALGRAREPWFFRRDDGEPFGLAALWETDAGPDGAPRDTCAVVTTAPNALMQPVHHRMPVMLTPEQCAAWLDPRPTTPAALAPLLRPPPAESMCASVVSRRVNNVRHDDPACLEPPGPDEAVAEEPQLPLGW